MSTVAYYYLKVLVTSTRLVIFRVIIDSGLLAQTYCGFLGLGIERDSRRIRHFVNAIKSTSNTDGAHKFFSSNSMNRFCFCSYLRKLSPISSEDRIRNSYQ